jgi:MoaA/NifB/PqqE/SkfB family radical SAM enzyme
MLNLLFYPRKVAKLLRYARAARNNELLTVIVYITERCNSRCKTCGIWRKKNPKDLPLELFGKILDGIGMETTVCVVGGEPLLHPDIDGILEALSQKGCPFEVVTNGLMPERVVGLTERYGIPRVSVSCDGVGETYRRVRGVGSYGNIVRLAERLAPITHLALVYVVSPWNTREDLLAVKGLCDRLGAELCVEVYDEIEYFGTTVPRMKRIYDVDGMQPFPKSMVLRLYERWASGKLPLSCHSIYWTCAVLPDGIVYVCGRRMVPLGDLREQTLAEIWKSERTAQLHAQCSSCNGCWAGFYRNVDVALGVMRNPSLLFRGDKRGSNE